MNEQHKPQDEKIPSRSSVRRASGARWSMHDPLTAPWSKQLDPSKQLYRAATGSLHSVQRLAEDNAWTQTHRAVQLQRVDTSNALLGLEQSKQDRAPKRRVGAKSRVASLFAMFDGAGVGLNQYRTFKDIEKADAQRMEMLALGRETTPVFCNPFSILCNPRSILSTVLPSLLIAPPTLLAAACFTCGALLGRNGLLPRGPQLSDTDPVSHHEGDALMGASVLISFLVAFYLGHENHHNSLALRRAIFYHPCALSCGWQATATHGTAPLVLA